MPRNAPRRAASLGARLAAVARAAAGESNDRVAMALIVLLSAGFRGVQKEFPQEWGVERSAERFLLATTASRRDVVEEAWWLCERFVAASILRDFESQQVRCAVAQSLLRQAGAATTTPARWHRSRRLVLGLLLASTSTPVLACV